MVYGEPRAVYCLCCPYILNWVIKDRTAKTEKTRQVVGDKTKHLLRPE
jgi:hypothetical protein